MNSCMLTNSLRSLVALAVLGSSAAGAVASQPSLDAVGGPPVTADPAIDQRLPTNGTTHDSDGKILAFSMPVLIDVVHAGSGRIIKVRAVRAARGKGMSMEVIGPIPPSATGTYSGLLPVSLDYN